MELVIAFAVGALLAYCYEAQADTLILPNGQNVDFQTFAYDSGTGVLRINGSDNPGPGPAPDPDPDPVVPSDVTVGYPVQDNESGRRVTVPAGRTLASVFIADARVGRFSIQPDAGQGRLTFWVSEQPGGEALPRCGISTSQVAFSLTWVTPTHASYCALARDKTYYINLKANDDNAGRFTVSRFTR